MNRQVLSVVWPLIVINAAALVLWLAANRWRVVLIGPPRRGLREIGSRGSGLVRDAIRIGVDRSSAAVRSVQAMRTTPRRPKHRATSAPRSAMQPPATVREPSHAPAAEQSEGLDAWIDEVEQQETRVADRRPEPVADVAEGSAAWWKAFAESGGALPGAAGSCRRQDAASDRTAAIL